MLCIFKNFNSRIKIYFYGKKEAGTHEWENTIYPKLVTFEAYEANKALFATVKQGLSTVFALSANKHTGKTDKSQKIFAFPPPPPPYPLNSKYKLWMVEVIGV